MIAQFFSKLSQNYIELLKDDEYYDVTIEVGEDPNVKIFRAHMNILCYRSPYLRQALASNKKNNDNILSHIKLPNTSPEIFQIILEYIYGGILSLDEKDTSDFLKVLATADKLSLQELVDYLQGYLIENSDDLQMKEIEVWEYVLKWGLAQNPTLIPDLKTWSDDDFKTMKNTLQHCLPFVRFYCLSPKEFSQKVRPYQKLLNQQLYEDMLLFYLDPDSVSSHNIQLPRKIKINKNIEEVICSQIVNSGIISTISRWIDKIAINNNNFNESYLPYKFELLLRGRTEEIIGGYNPSIWESCANWVWGKAEERFIFSFKNKNNFKDAILSKIIYSKFALCFGPTAGPHFGGDINICASNVLADYNFTEYFKGHYEKNIRDSEGKFTIEDYEVFKITKK
ncbi:uncharacterized protein OCT59_009790 [Rhizophagus irregularis]|uniref:uncharacterized protein n=1 Tax=Rhizophagus irregularis TaxID=588596 RepID=UPI0033263519|nr:hypothetical protein OCT59_009790 [Rhizophagus irregularis]